MIGNRVFICGMVLTSLSAITAAKADDWMLRRQSPSLVCHVQLKTAAPLGSDFKGPFDSRKKACQSGADNYDKEMSDTTKCWGYGGGTISGCANDGITLPPT
jgi:hypothetical protein